MNDTRPENLPAAACPRCGGWMSCSGMDQHSKSATPVLGRTGCTCYGALPEPPLYTRLPESDRYALIVAAGKLAMKHGQKHDYLVWLSGATITWREECELSGAVTLSAERMSGQRFQQRVYFDMHNGHVRFTVPASSFRSVVPVSDLITLN